MIERDLILIFEWWIVLFLLGITFLPLTTYIFNSFFDKGYIFSKVIGLVVVSYLSWLVSSLHILPFNNLSLYLIITAGLLLNSYLLFKTNLLHQIRNIKYQILISEILFTVGLFFWSIIRGFEPSLHGLEKFMDFGIINSIIRSDYFPPKDIWMTPLDINYYYFGHLSAAVLIKLSGISSVVSYNLVLSSLFGICLSASFSIGANLYHSFQPLATRWRLLAGSLSAFLVTLAGNLHPIYLFFQSYVPADNPVPFWTLPLKLNFAEYWYPNATRFIPNTIHEFPLYSFVVADLHGHVLNIPFVLLFIALLVHDFFSAKIHPLRLTLYALLLAIFLMTNVLDGPIYLLVLSTLLLVKFGISFRAVITHLSIITMLTIFFSLPFWLHFIPFASGIGVMCAPQFLIEIGRLGPFLFEADHCSPSPVWMLLILWGLPLTLTLGFIKFFGREIKDILNIKNTDLLVLTLATAAFILIMIPEMFYAKDIYPQHYRANTVFKFGYQAFIILGLISGYMITRLISNLKIQKSKLLFLFFILNSLFFILAAIYPYFATTSYYGLKEYRGLDGLSYLSSIYPDDYLAIVWLRDNIEGQPVILEANGDSYTDYLRVSSNTGLPTVAGWPVHEWLWRGDYGGISARIPEVQSIYESEDLAKTNELIKKYNLSYIFIGALERQKYPKLQEEKLTKLGEMVFQSGQTNGASGTKIIKLPVTKSN